MEEQMACWRATSTKCSSTREGETRGQTARCYLSLLIRCPAYRVQASTKSLIVRASLFAKQNSPPRRPPTIAAYLGRETVPTPLKAFLCPMFSWAWVAVFASRTCTRSDWLRTHFRAPNVLLMPHREYTKVVLARSPHCWTVYDLRYVTHTWGRRSMSTKVMCERRIALHLVRCAWPSQTFPNSAASQTSSYAPPTQSSSKAVTLAANLCFFWPAAPVPPPPAHCKTSFWWRSCWAPPTVARRSEVLLSRTGCKLAALPRRCLPGSFDPWRPSNGGWRKNLRDFSRRKGR